MWLNLRPCYHHHQQQFICTFRTRKLLLFLVLHLSPLHTNTNTNTTLLHTFTHSLHDLWSEKRRLMRVCICFIPSLTLHRSVCVCVWGACCYRMCTKRNCFDNLNTKIMDMRNSEHFWRRIMDNKMNWIFETYIYIYIFMSATSLSRPLRMLS